MIEGIFCLIVVMVLGICLGAIVFGQPSKAGRASYERRQAARNQRAARQAVARWDAQSRSYGPRMGYLGAGRSLGWSRGQMLGAGLGALAVGRMIHNHHQTERIGWDIDAATAHANHGDPSDWMENYTEYYDTHHHHMW